MPTPRSQTWTKPTVLMTLVLLSLVLATVITNIVIGEAPTYLTGLLGTAAGAWFAAIANDKKKFDAAVSQAADNAQTTANRAEAKADTLADVHVNDAPEPTTRGELLGGPFAIPAPPPPPRRTPPPPPPPPAPPGDVS